MRLSILFRLSTIAMFGCFFGCVLYEADRDEDLCINVSCGQHANCEQGVCACDAGYSGNADNFYGCQPTTPDPDTSSCEPACGENAHCSNSQCECNAGSVAICGTADCLPEARVCDGKLDCEDGKDEAFPVCHPIVQQTWLWTDACDDGLDIELRLFAQDRQRIWPDKDSVFFSAGYQVDNYQDIKCSTGESICFGGQVGEGEDALTWGVGLDGTLECGNCCFACDDNLIDAGLLTCD